jgi:DNA-binding transcriptional regulator PaaX
MAKKPNISKAILKILSQKQVFSATDLKEKAVEIVEMGQESHQKPEYAIARSIKNMAENGLIEAFQSPHNDYFRLTHEGKQKLHSLNLEVEGSIVSTTWDGYWRIILLDLPESRKNERESLRYLLKKAGFICLKNSAWISPYPFEHMFTSIKKDLGLTSEMMIIVTDKLDPSTEEAFLNIIKEK